MQGYTEDGETARLTDKENSHSPVLCQYRGIFTPIEQSKASWER